MAFRIHESVGRGEIDNRVRGIVRAARRELFEIREGIFKLMDEFRGRK